MQDLGVSMKQEGITLMKQPSVIELFINKGIEHKEKIVRVIWRMEILFVNIIESLYHYFWYCGERINQVQDFKNTSDGFYLA